MHYIAQQGLKRHLEKQKRDEQRVGFVKHNSDWSSNKTAADEVSFQTKHLTSMSDALKEVRKNKVTHEDTTQVTRPNSKGFYE